MLEILKYIFSSPWIFVGIIMLIYVIGEVVGNIVENVCRALNTSKAVKYSDKTDTKIE